MCYLGEAFFAGMKDGYDQTTAVPINEKTQKTSTAPTERNMVDISFEPNFSTMLRGTDSLTFTNGERYQTIMTRSMIMVPKEKYSSGYSWGVNVLYITCLVLYVLLLVQFIRFIININNGNIFDKKNVTRLRRFALYLISISVLKCIAGLIEDSMLSGLSLSLEGYTLSAYWEIPWDTMLLGLLALLMAQVWSYGLQLKEDQALTI